MNFLKDDSAGSIGRRYARTDEIGIPFGITVDFKSQEQPWTVTLRYALTMEQVRLKVCFFRFFLCSFRNCQLFSQFFNSGDIA